MDYKECLILLSEFDGMSRKDVNLKINTVLNFFSKKKVSEAINISESAFNCYINNGNRKISFSYYATIMCMDERSTDYVKYYPVVELVGQFSSRNIESVKDEVRAMTRKYSFEYVSEKSTIPQNTLHYYTRNNCSNVPFEKFVRIMTIPQHDEKLLRRVRGRDNSDVIESMKLKLMISKNSNP